MRIKSVKTNNRRKCIEIETAKGLLSLPFSRLRLQPTRKDSIQEIYVDKEFGRKGVTYTLSSGKQDSIHVDAFLDYNRDPVFLRNVALHKLSLEAVKRMNKSKLSNRNC